MAKFGGVGAGPDNRKVRRREELASCSFGRHSDSGLMSSNRFRGNQDSASTSKEKVGVVLRLGLDGSRRKLYEVVDWKAYE